MGKNDKSRRKKNREGGEAYKAGNVKRHKKKYGKAGSKRLNAEEEGRIRKETMRKQELAEIKQNLWKPTERMEKKL